MIRCRYDVSFVTPAFLGNAEQRGQWRVPPFKALLRQWWRVVKARDVDYDFQELRRLEAQRFGWAGNEDQHGGASHKSAVRLWLDGWGEGNLRQWAPDVPIVHKEVKRPTIGAQLYLGYGPLNVDRNKKGSPTILKRPPAIDANTSNGLTVICPEAYQGEIQATMQLIHWFGTIGGRSRNGWGSLSIGGSGIEGCEGLLAGNLNDVLRCLVQPLDECLNRQWPHALGEDGKPLIWRTKPREKWKDVMKELAEAKVAFRIALPFQGAKGWFNDRHLLAYPVSGHEVGKFDKKDRLANQLRFKVLDSNAGLVGIAYHLPCGFPDTLANRLAAKHRPTENYQLGVWQRVHAELDAHLTRISTEAI